MAKQRLVLGRRKTGGFFWLDGRTGVCLRYAGTWCIPDFGLGRFGNAPPMAIFFPLFTLLEDLGYLPRVAFNLDRYFKKCSAMR